MKMENFGKKVKNLVTTGLFVGTSLAGFTKEAPKTVEKDLASKLNTTIAYNGPESNIGVITNNQEQESARQTLINTQTEFNTAIAGLKKTFAYDAVMMEKLNEISDLSQKVSVFTAGFMKDRMENLDSEKVQEYITDAIEFATSKESPMFFKENAVLEDFKDAMLGSVVYQDGFNTENDHPAGSIIVSKGQTANASFGGQGNIFSRLIADNIKHIAENAGVKFTPSSDQSSPLASR